MGTRTRREFLKYIGAGIVGVGIGYVGGFLTPRVAETQFITTTKTELETVTKTIPATVITTGMPLTTITTGELDLREPFAGWSLKEAAKPYRGASIRMVGEFLPPLEAVVKLKDIFEDETGISVDIEMYEETEVVEKVSFDLASGAGIYDIVAQPFGKLGKLVENNWLVPLDVFLKNPKLTPPGFDPDKIYFKGKTGKAPWGKDLTQGIYRALAEYKGVLYGLVDKCHSRRLWYRKDLWFDPHHREKIRERYGFELKGPEDVWHLTTEQYKMLSEYFTMNGEFPLPKYGTCIEGKRHPALFYSFCEWLFQFGGGFIDHSYPFEYGRVIINQPEAVKALEYMKSLVPYCPPGTLEYFWDDAMAAFQGGLIAHTIMWEDASYAIVDPSVSKVAAELGARNACGFGPLPYVPEKGIRSFKTHGWTDSIPYSSKNKEAAWLFMLWLSSFPVDLEKHLKGGVSGRPDVCKYVVENIDNLVREGRTLPGVEEYTASYMRMYEEHQYVPSPTFPEADIIMEVMIENLSLALTGQLTPKDALDQAAETIVRRIPKLTL
jgi:multiple sugar transport system substrate-binding protein